MRHAKAANTADKMSDDVLPFRRKWSVWISESITNRMKSGSDSALYAVVASGMDMVIAIHPQTASRCDWIC